MNLPASLELILGPMMSSKTTEVIRRLTIFHEMELKVLYVNSVLDTRSDSAFSTHNATLGKVPFPCVKVGDLKGYEISDYDVIALDEAQFFSELIETVLDWVENKRKIVIVAGLNGDFRREAFGQVGELVRYADSITKLFAYCVPCRKKGILRKAHFSKKIKSDSKQIEIGGKETYSPTCRECYIEK